MENTLKLKDAGSLINFLMGNNKSKPVVGKGATILHFSDRSAYEVISVNEDKKSVVIQRYKPKRLDNFGMSDNQVYEYKELSDEKITLYYRWGSWKTKSKIVTFTDEAREKFGSGPKLHEEYKKLGGDYVGAFVNTVIPGLTESLFEYNNVNIIFGIKREYYDYSF